MKNLLIIILFTVLLGGCTVNFGKTKPEPEKKPEVTQKHKPWPQEGKEYWYARYFFTMAMNPQVQLRITPKAVFAIVKCTMDKYEEDHSWEWFEENLAETLIIKPEISQYVYNVTKVCAETQRAADEAEALKKKMSLPIKPEDSV